MERSTRTLQPTARRRPTAAIAVDVDVVKMIPAKCRRLTTARVVNVDAVRRHRVKAFPTDV